MVHNHPAAVVDLGNDGRFKVFRIGKLQKPVRILGIDDYRHALLRFAYRKLGAVKSFIFLGYGVEIYLKAVRQFAYRNRYAACAEIVAAFDKPCCLAV